MREESRGVRTQYGGVKPEREGSERGEGFFFEEGRGGEGVHKQMRTFNTGGGSRKQGR